MGQEVWGSQILAKESEASATAGCVTPSLSFPIYVMS